MQATDFHIFVTFPFCLYMSLIATFSSHFYGWEEDLDQICLGYSSKGKYVIWSLELHGCNFPGSLCHTQTMINGNVLCSLISFIFQHVTLTRSYRVTYLQYEQHNEVIICTKMIRHPHYKWYCSLRESS